jgi:transcriptional regulator with XRE-family HTH domain
MARQSKKHEKNGEKNVSGEESDDIVRIVARRLQEARKRVGLTQTQLGERAGVTQNYIYELEYGTTNITIRTLEKMVNALNLDMRDFLPGPPLAIPSGEDLAELHRGLDGLVVAVKQHLADERRQAEKETARRLQHEAALLKEINAFSELRDGLARLINAKSEEKGPTE